MLTYHNGPFSVESSEMYSFLVSHYAGQEATMAHPSPYSDSGTQGFSTMWLYQEPWRPAAPPYSAGNEHRPTVCRTDGRAVSGRPRVSHSQLVPPLARPKPHRPRGSEVQNRTNTVSLGTRDSTPTLLSLNLCSQLCPPSGRIP